MTGADADAVLHGYQAGLDGGQASFETTAPAWHVFDRDKLPDHRQVAVNADDAVVGRVAVSAVSARPVYAGMVDHSVYVAPAAHGRGVGTAPLNALIGLHRNCRHLGHPIRDLSGEHRQPAPAPEGRIPGRWPARAYRPPARTMV